MEYRVQPEAMPVDQPREVRVTATLDQPLRAGDNIAFALPEAWSSRRCCVTFTKEPQYTDPEAPDYVAVVAEGARFELSLEKIPLASGDPQRHVRKIVAKLIEGELRAGTDVVLELRNFRSTWLAEAGVLRVWVGDDEEKHPPKLKTLAVEAERLRVIVPSSARPGAPFKVNIVSLDPFWNRSSSTYREGVLTLQGGESLEEGIGFTGSYRTRAAIAEPGVYRLRLGDELSNPIRITPAPRGPYWGDLHSHDKTHNCGAGEDPYTYARQVSGLDFLAVTPDYRGLSQAVWREHVRRCNESYEPGEFTTILGYEAGFPESHHNLYFRGAEAEIFDVADPSQRSIEKLLAQLDPDVAFAVPHHVGIDWCTQTGYRPEWDPWIPLMEIYSQHGLSEFYSPEHILSYEFNRTRGMESKYATSVNKPVYARDAWSQGRRFGVIASSDDHMAQPGKPVKGLAAVFAPENAREALFSSLKARRTYGTTGERILLDFRINGCEMGQEVFVDGSSPLKIDMEVHGTDGIAFVEVARLRFGNQTWESAFFERLRVQRLFDATSIDEDCDYAASFEERCEGDAVYYLRVGQKKQLADWPVYAWSSPIWVTKG